MGEHVVIYGGGIIVLILILVYIIMKKRSSDAKEMNELDTFLRNIRSKVEEAILDYIMSVDITNFVNLTDAQIDILNALYDKMWDLAVDELANMQDQHSATLIKKVLTRENIEYLVKSLYSTTKIQQSFTQRYNSAVLLANKEALAEELRATNFANNIIQNNINEIPTDDSIQPMPYPMANPEINPPVDEESDTVDADDDSIEIMDE